MSRRTRIARATKITPLAAALVLTAMGGTAHAADVNRSGIPDSWERKHGLSLAVNQARRDRDGDGLNNLYEYRARTNPKARDSDRDGTKDGAEDTDRDKLTNRQEQLSQTHPRDVDSNNDGVSDDSEDEDCDGLKNDEEFVVGTLPLDRDRDKDGVTDGHEDTDRDGLANDVEFALGHNPKDADSDDDGTRDGRETAGTVVSFDGTSLVLRDLLGAVTTITVSANAELDMDDVDTTNDESQDEVTVTLAAALIPGVVISEVEIDPATGAATKIEIAENSDLSEDTLEGCSVDDSDD